MLQTAQLGQTDMHITRAGFGAWAIGGGGWSHAWGEQDDAESIAAIRYAVESGVNWIDTAAIYGLGHSEEVVGRAVRDIPEADRPYIFTKGGLAWDESDRSAAARRVGEPASLRREVESSLRRLEAERIDLYQMHWPAADGTPLEEYWQTFAELKAEGKVRAIGLSNHDVDALERAEAIDHVDSLQPPFNLIRREAAGDVIPWCAKHGTGVIVYSPMASGLLTGSFTEERAAALGDDDWRSRSKDFKGEGLRRNLALVEDLRPVAERNETSVAALAVAWTLAFTGVTGAIVGARRPDQIDGWLPAINLNLDDQDLSDIGAAIRAHGIGDGPALP
ncbi:aldo/keto reductase [Phytoactinopolyspora endophytica]|uniref:aldo/keto reductase n=1 Tax=Phytoactinopolyspora endophytica TaxID=1642495 RepID=UPI00197C7959|nr:aldo/keto reductase [Phytoactinopolyspora endophytica]